MLRPRLLLVAYHFPPIQGSTGVARTIATSKYLAERGWDVRVLTVQSEAYEYTAPENDNLIPRQVTVERAWARDARQSFSIAGKYPSFLALPDRWQSWLIGAALKVHRLIDDLRPNVILTTYPIPTAHVIGLYLHRRYKIPWVAEFRDPMLQSDYPRTVAERWLFGKIERQVFSHAQEVIVTTDGCRNLYLQRYANWPAKRISTIPNGYDPAMFDDIPSQANRDTDSQRPLVLLHSGLLYPSERNPLHFFSAIKQLKEEGFLHGLNVQFHFRASGNESQYQELVDQHGIGSYVRLLPRIPYSRAVAEMTTADALMIFQASNCNDQIPAKIYEYMYAQKPILALTDPIGETARLLRSVGVDSIAALDNQHAIADLLKVFLLNLKTKNSFVVPRNLVSQFSRSELTSVIERVLLRAISN